LLQAIDIWAQQIIIINTHQEIFKNFAQNARIVTLFSVATGDEIYAINTSIYIFYTYTYVYMRTDQNVTYDYTAEDFSGHVWTCFWMS
jgi:predicted lactoylglutathione lyase